MIGTVLCDTYRIDALIERGGMGAVYLASHCRLPRRFAVKVLLRQFAGDRLLVARFQREAEICSRLGHPNIVEVVDFNRTHDGIPYIVMELLEGQDLAARLRRQGCFEPAPASAILSQVASALAAAHHQGVVHRDLKPKNIFLCRREGQPDLVKVLDFGISKVKGGGTRLTQTDAIMGTPSYMAPEQALGGSIDADARSDIYSAGAILYEMLAGRPPHVADNIGELYLRIADQDPPPIGLFRPDLAEDLEQVVMRALQRDPTRRQQSVLELAESFARAAQRAAARAEALAEAPTLRRGQPGDTPTLLRAPPEPRAARRRERAAEAVSQRTLIPLWRRGSRSARAVVAWFGTRRWAMVAAAVALPLTLVCALVLRASAPEEARPSPSDRYRPKAPTRRDLGSRLPDVDRGADQAGPPDARLDGAAVGSPDSTADDLEAPRSRTTFRRSGLRRRPRASSARIQPGVLSVTVLLGGDPTRATVFLDGRHLGDSPLQVPVAPGVHTLTIKRQGYPPTTREVQVQPGQTESVNWRLVR